MSKIPKSGFEPDHRAYEAQACNQSASVVSGESETRTHKPVRTTVFRTVAVSQLRFTSPLSIYLKPLHGFEPWTNALQMRCSTN